MRSLTTLRFIKYLKNKSKTWTSLSKMCKQCVTANTYEILPSYLYLQKMQGMVKKHETSPFTPGPGIRYLLKALKL